MPMAVGPATVPWAGPERRPEGIAMANRLVGTVATTVPASGVLPYGGWLPGGPGLARAQCVPHWETLGAGAAGNVNARAEYAGVLYAGGWFSTAKEQAELQVARTASDPSLRINAVLAVVHPHDRGGDIPQGIMASKPVRAP